MRKISWRRKSIRYPKISRRNPTTAHMRKRHQGKQLPADDSPVQTPFFRYSKKPVSFLESFRFFSYPIYHVNVQVLDWPAFIRVIRSILADTSGSNQAKHHLIGKNNLRVLMRPFYQIRRENYTTLLVRRLRTKMPTRCF